MAPVRRRRRRVLNKIELTEISAVDRPCQEHAKVTIMKRADDPHLVSKSDTDLAGGSAGDHTSTGANMATGDDAKVATLEKEVADLEKLLEDMSKQLDTSGTSGGDADARSEEIEKTLGDLTAKVEELTKALSDKDEELELAKKTSTLTDDEKEHLGKQTSAKDKEAFLSMSAEDRKKAMKKAADGDETLSIAGRTITKSVVGEDQFAIFKKQAEDIATAQTELAKERDARVMSDLRKRADDEFPHVPGSVDDRASMLKAMSAMDGDIRRSFETVLKQSEALAKKAFETVGVKDPKELAALEKRNSDGNEFEKKISEIASRDKIGKTEAMQKARGEYPDLFKAFQEADRAN
jgi:hypothetical protein